MLTPQRASWLVALLSAAAVGATLGATALAGRLQPPSRSAPADLFSPLRVARVDVHQHLAPGTLDVALDVADAHGIDTLVNLSGGAAGAGLEEQLAAAATRPGRVIVFMNLDLDGCCDAGWASREAARLARGKALGARGLEVGKVLGLGLVDGEAIRRGTAVANARLPVDTPLLQPIWDACASLSLPVTLQSGDPKAFFDPPGPGNERAAELAFAPQWSFADRARFPSWQVVFDEMVRLLERNPRVAFVGAHFGNDAEDPATVARLMDRLPQLWVDLAARVPELGRRPEAARAAILSHPDRVLFGTGVRYVTDGAQRGIVLGSGQPILLDRLLGGRDRRLFFDGAFRFLETRDPDIPSPTPIQGTWSVTGVGLPRAVLEQVYHRNAERLLRLPQESGR